MSPLIRRFGFAARAMMTGLAVLTAGCVSELVTTSPDQTVTNSSESADLSPMSLSQANSAMTGSGLRIEVRIQPGRTPLVATELAIDGPDAAREPEKVQANITAIESSGSGWIITTDLGGLKINFDGATTFTREDATAALTSDQFVAAVNLALAANQHPHMTARRPAPASPQAPGDGSFLADQIRIGSGDGLKLELNVGPGSLELNLTPPPDAFLKMLGLTIELRISDGTTRIGRRQEKPGNRVEFAGEVKSVYVERKAFVLGSGVTVIVNDQTEFKGEQFHSLADVKGAMDAGAMVGVEGEGVVSTLEPRVILAKKLEFHSRPRVTEFKEGVKSVDAGGGRFTLTNGAVLCVNNQTVIDPNGDFTSLADVASALAAGKLVVAAGTASPAPSVSDCRALVLRVRFTLRPPPTTEFKDLVKSVDVDGRRMTLGSGAVFCFNDQSVIDQDGNPKSLAGVADALATGKVVVATGVATPANTTAGTVTNSGCRALVLKVRFGIVEPPSPIILEFHEGVKSVDAAGHSFTLSNGVTLCLNDRSVIAQDGDLKGMADVAAALAANQAVKADGVATPATTAAATCRAVVVKVKFSYRI